LNKYSDLNIRSSDNSNCVDRTVDAMVHSKSARSERNRLIQLTVTNLCDGSCISITGLIGIKAI